MQSKAATVEQYLAELPADRRAVLSAVREVIRKHLDADYEEGIQYGMIGYYVPHRVFPAGYHTDPKQPLPFAALASQKSHMALYLMGLYGESGDCDGEGKLLRWFKEAWARTGKKLEMGKSCIRFKKLSDLPLELIGETVARMPARAYIERYQATLASTRTGSRAAAAARGSRKAARSESQARTIH